LTAPGLAPTGGGLGAAGLAATGRGFGLAATGGGALPPVGVDDLGLSVEAEVGAIDFFQGVADPFAGAIPGNTDTGLADASAATDVGVAFTVGIGAGLERGGGGGAAGAVFGGTNSR
jgi:hypothetical protein